MLAKIKEHHVVINAITAQCLWFVCVLGGVRHANAMIWFTVAPLVGLQLLLVTEGRARLLVGILIVTFVGVVQDSFLTVIGVLDPVRSVLPFPWTPLWLAALWLNFASMAAICLSRLGRHTALALVAGAVGGPLAYLGGERFGAVIFPVGKAAALAALAVAWALMAGFALVWLPAKLRRGSGHCLVPRRVKSCV